ncbi:Uncharacterized membrane protein, DUF4010 family [Halovenus aranensis]|uniref:Uncharacterized membrane protein, DUF4010 family n=1 Tax=Halovenus aranensis TaxID=890420 RepID=A0A1G8V0J8_9EURY|nr:MgtC/SapB family protein [Halovenus aranensis]SDJ58865.1 Uncharacterized membrane protein, DUF4010 family [Halovenus aranensis]
MVVTESIQAVGGFSPEYLLSEYPDVMKVVFATALGVLLGVEREWSERPAGLRTFTIITLTGTVLTIVDEPYLVVLGAVLVVVQGAVFAVQGLVSGDENYLLTTSMSMVLAYGVGVLIGNELYQVGVVVSIVATMLLVLRRELHGFARGLSKDEIQSALEFGILAFVVFPLLPDQSFGPSGTINPRTIWLLVVAVSGIGFVNYLVVQRYGTKGIAITSFFGGLVNSTAVLGEIVSRARNQTGFTSIAVGSILLANAAMAFRDMFIVVTFVPELAINVGAPLVAIAVAGIGMSYVVSDWELDFEMEFESPFNLTTALKFGGLFLLVLTVSATARSLLGTSGFLLSSFLGGMVSSGAVTTSVVLLVDSGQVGPGVASSGIIAAVSGSILVKLALAISMDRSVATPVTVATAALIAVGVAATGLTVAFLA